MKSILKHATQTSLLLATLLSSQANAMLIDRGNGLIYDSVQDITWIQDANYAQTSGYDAVGAMTWQASMDWAAQLNYGGFDDWRLFNAAPDDTNCSNNITLIGFDTQYFGSECTANELGHLYYNEFNLTGGQQITSASGDTEYDLFTNIQDFAYWSGTEYAPSTGSAWFFQNYNGFQGSVGKSNILYAWAVRDGDVAATEVSAPSNMALLALGSLGLVMRRRRLR